ncbi:hypothetical protein HJA86_28170 [Rhizobium bangladeshense]|nr:hypothetical protein [Rhizobium bangladeshense]
MDRSKWSVVAADPGLMTDAVMHGIVETAVWFDDFEEEAYALADAAPTTGSTLGGR